MIKDTVEQDFKVAFKNKENEKVGTLRLIKSEFTKLEKGATEPDNVLYIQTLRKMVKQREDSAKTYSDANRSDLADKELAEIAVIQEYIPQPMSEKDVTKLVVKIFDKHKLEYNIKNMGRVVNLTLQAAEGRADGKIVSTIVKHFIDNVQL